MVTGAPARIAAARGAAPCGFPVASCSVAVRLPSLVAGRLSTRNARSRVACTLATGSEETMMACVLLRPVENSFLLSRKRLVIPARAALDN